MKNSTFNNGIIFLKENDPVLCRIITNMKIKKPKKRSLDFSTFVSVIINQQLSGKAADTIKNRVVNLCSGSLTIENFNKLSVESLLNCGLSRSKILYIQNISEYLTKNNKFLTQLKSMDLNTLVETLIKFKGIGIWSSNIIALFYIGHPDVYPYGDGTLNKAISKLYSDNNSKVDLIVESWTPYRSVASIILWQWVDNGMKDFS